VCRPLVPTSPGRQVVSREILYSYAHFVFLKVDISQIGRYIETQVGVPVKAIHQSPSSQMRFSLNDDFLLCSEIVRACEGHFLK
jgi:hypothetical protein